MFAVQLPEGRHPPLRIPSPGTAWSSGPGDRERDHHYSNPGGFSLYPLQPLQYSPALLLRDFNGLDPRAGKIDTQDILLG